MRARSREPGLPYEAFRQLVSAYPRSALLRQLAAVSVQLEIARRNGRRPTNGAVQPFALAGIARTVLQSGNDLWSREVTDELVARLCSAFVDVSDPAIVDGRFRDNDARNELMARLAYEQFPSQYSPAENLGRTTALLLDHSAGIPGAPTDEQWTSLLGVNLEQYMRVGFAAFTAMVANGGAIARGLLGAPHVQPVWGDLSADQALGVLDRHFIASPGGLRERATADELEGYEKWSVNPLVSRPLVAIGGDLVAPAVHYVVDKITPTGLYYTCAPAWRDPFTKALGLMFESYVGAQLALVKAATVHPEVVFGKSERKSCDWFWVFDDVVVLVEVKSARPSHAVRIGAAGSTDELERKVSKAADQLAATAKLIRSRHKAFRHIPAGRPLVGLIVTLEPFHLRPTMQTGILSRPGLPITLAWAHDLEGTVGGLQVEVDAGARLLRALGGRDPQERDLRAAAEGLNSRNPIIDAAWERWGVWPSPPD